jgi:hypothetical protein
MTLEGGNMKLESSVVDISMTSRISAIVTKNDCNIYLYSGIGNNFIFENNTFIGSNVGGFSGLMSV